MAQSIQAIVSHTDLIAHFGEAMNHKFGSLPNDDNSQDDRDDDEDDEDEEAGDLGGLLDGSCVSGGTQSIFSCASMMVFTFGSIADVESEKESRATANATLFLFYVKMMNHFQIAHKVMMECIRVRKSSEMKGNHSQAEPSKQLRGVIRAHKFEGLGANAKFFLKNHAPSKGTYVIGTRAWILPLQRDVRWGRMIEQFMREVDTKTYKESSPGVPARIAAISSVQTLARVTAQALGDRTSSGRGGYILRKFASFERGCSADEIKQLDPRVLFNAKDGVSSSADVLADGSEHSVGALRNAIGEFLDPVSYGTLVAKCDGKFEAAEDSDQEDDDAGDGDGVDDLEQDDIGSPSGSDAARDGGKRNTKRGGMTGESSGFVERVGVSRPLPSHCKWDSGPDKLHMHDKVSTGTLVHPDGAQFVAFQFSCAEALLVQRSPFDILPGEVLLLKHLGRCLDDIPVYHSTTPVLSVTSSKRHCNGLDASASASAAASAGEGDSVEEEEMSVYNRRQYLSRILEHVSKYGSLPRSYVPGARKVRGLAGEPQDTSIDEIAKVCHNHLAELHQWFERDNTGPFFGRSDPYALSLRSEFTSVVKSALLFRFHETLFNPNNSKSEFWWKILDFWDEHLTADKFDARCKLCQEVTSSRQLDPFALPIVEEVFRQTFEVVDVLFQLVRTHELFLKFFLCACGAATPCLGVVRTYLFNILCAGAPGSGKSFTKDAMNRALVPGTVTESIKATDNSSLVIGRAKNNGTFCPVNKNMTVVNDEATPLQLGVDDPTDRLQSNAEYAQRMGQLKQLYGNNPKAEVKRAYMARRPEHGGLVEDDGAAFVRTDHVDFPGAHVLLSNTRRRPDPAIVSRFITVYSWGGAQCEGARPRGDAKKSEILGRTAAEKMPESQTDSYLNGFFRSTHAINSYYLLLRAAGFVDDSAQDKMSRDIVNGVLRRLKQDLPERELNKLLGMVDIANGVFKIIGGMFHMKGDYNVTRGMPFGGKIDREQPHCVAYHLYEVLTRMYAPNPSATLYMIGNTAGQIHSKQARKLLLVWMGGIAGLTQFDTAAVRRHAQRTNTDAAFLLDQYAQAMTVVRLKVGESDEDDVYCHEYVNLGLKEDPLAVQLGVAKMPMELIRMTLEEMRNENFQSYARPQGVRGGGKTHIKWSSQTGAVNQRMVGRPVLNMRGFNPEDKTITVHVLLAAIVDAVESLEFPGGCHLGPMGEQGLPKTYTELDQDTVVRIRTQEACRDVMRDSGFPRGARYMSGFFAETKANTFPSYPDLFEDTAPDSDSAPDAAAAAAPQDTAASAPRHTMAYTGLDAVSGMTRSERMGLVDDSAPDDTTASRGSIRTVDEKAAIQTLGTPTYLHDLCVSSGIRNGVLHKSDMVVVPPRADDNPRASDTRYRAVFPHPAACIAGQVSHEHARFDITQYRNERDRADTAIFDEYPHNYVRAAQRSYDQPTLIGDACDPIASNRNRPNRTLGLDDVPWDV